MKKILVDSSVWIEYFRGNPDTLSLNNHIDNNTICVTDLILCEILPALTVRKEVKLIRLFKSITNFSVEIDWPYIQMLQVSNLKKGLNKIGIPDLILVQCVRDHDLQILTLDKHFVQMGKLYGFTVIKL